MATVSRGLPARPHLDVPKREARELLRLFDLGDVEALDRVRRRHPRFNNTESASSGTADFKLSDAQLVIAREYGFSNWAALKQRIEARPAASALEEAIDLGNSEEVARILRAHPEMLHLPVRSGNWGPPMSDAANRGRLDIIQVCAELGAGDYQHAFDRAVLQGQIECARWLHAHGAKLQPGIIMGSCETLKASGFRFLMELGAPISDSHGDPLAPLALVLETYNRNPAGKHAILDLFVEQNYRLPDTPIMALHRGDVSALEKHFREQPQLLDRKFSIAEIYPAECGCGRGDGPGMHWTPIDGTTLLHLAIDFREREVFDWLLAKGADVHARAAVDKEGFGGHTPLFNTVVCGPWPDGTMASKLLELGADKGRRASLRKFIDWIENPHWHEARDVTAAEWAHGFPERNWINTEALRVIEADGAG